ncbi:hypothetical protein BJY00DRAFT_185754 [Aspergillus carlsbadensis]|nr:hypothetical protein BJY00DRAFT_185754 [Aspergillus carlsbadensis]
MTSGSDILSSYYDGRYSTLYVCLHPAALSTTAKARQNPSLLYHHAHILSLVCVLWSGWVPRPTIKDKRCGRTRERRASTLRSPRHSPAQLF